MPAPGDQHQSWSNPYEPTKARVSEWTARDIATIASKLDKQLGPEYISARAGPGGQKVHYLTAEKCITLANEVFGFNGWSSSIQNIQIDFADENPQTQRVSIGLSVIVRVTLKDGTYHEDIGYGSIDNARGKAMAFEKAKKEGTTDGLKRALRSFGNVLGNCIYDKDYISQVVKIKANPVKKWDQNNLHRHSDFIKKEEAPSMLATVPPVPQTAAVPPLLTKEPSDLEDFLGELDEADFCVPEDGHPDEVMLPPPTKAAEPPVKAAPNESNHGQNSRQSSRGPSANSHAPQTPGAAPPTRPSAPSNGPTNSTAQNAQAPPETVGFFSARAVNGLPEASLQNVNAIPSDAAQFNPKAESPSIRRTPGIDHNSSRPLAKNGQHVAPSASQADAGAANAVTNGNKGSFTPVRPGQPRPAGPTGPANAANPSIDHARRVGAPGGGGSPLANRGSYKPPTMKRPPLADLPNTANGAGSGTNACDSLDSKRQKMG